MRPLVPTLLMILASCNCTVAPAAGVGSKATTPSGKFYEVLNKGPILGIKDGTKTLGLSYRIDSLGDGKRVADEASDLMSALLPERVGPWYPVIPVKVVPSDPAGDNHASLIKTTPVRGPAKRSSGHEGTFRPR